MKSVLKNGEANLPYIFAPSLIIFLSLTLAGLFYDAIRIAFLFIPGCFIFIKYINSSNKIYLFIAHLWAFIFSSYLTLKLFCWVMYTSELDSVFIIEAVSNTNKQELIEFMLHNSKLIFIFLLFCSLFNIWYLLPYIRRKKPYESSLFKKALMVSTITITIAAYAIEPSRSLHPAVFWPNFASEVNNFKVSMKNNTKIFKEWDENAKKENIIYNGPDNQTIVLVIGESITSKNFGLCGYERNTTPLLEKLKSEISLSCNTYSSAASTVPSLRNMLTDESLTKNNNKNLGSLFSRAKAAGYKTYWISNQDDEYSSATFGKYADQAYYLNNKSGRTSISTDDIIFNKFKEVLSKPEPLKLIVILTIGAHPNYNMRFPSDFDIYNIDTEDSVVNNMKSKNLSFNTIAQRNNYDNAVRFHDFVLSNLLTNFISIDPNHKKTFIYTSDHGNEVGHYRNFSGHSPKTQAGYSVPLFIWSNRNFSAFNFTKKLIVTDTIDTTTLNLMDIRWSSYDSTNDFLSKSYKDPFASISKNFLKNKQ